MKERIRTVAHKARNPKMMGALLLSTVAFAGCGSKVDGAHRKIADCDLSSFNARSDKKPISSSMALTKKAEHDVATLYHRANQVDGKIDLAVYPNQTEVESGKNTLTINFPSGDGATDSVHFDIKNGEAHVGKGAVICASNGNLYPNETFAALQTYQKATVGLDK